MIQILSKIAKEKASFNPMMAVPNGFLVLRSPQLRLVKPMKIQTLLFVLIYVFLFGSSNISALNKSLLFNSSPTLLANAAPIAVDDIKSVDEDNVLSGSVATNDFDPDGDVLTFSTTSIPPSTQGTIVLSANGAFMFTPAKDFFGIVNIGYRACDPGGLCANATLTITVKPVNDRPKAFVSLAFTNENVPLNGDLKSNVFDIDNLPTDFTFTQIGTMATSEGTFTVSPSGVYVYTPAVNFSGTTAVAFKVCDSGNLCDTSALVITVVNVNDPPIAVNDNTSTIEDQLVTGTVAANDSDPDNLPAELTYTLVAPVSPSVGTIVFNANGTYKFTPAANYTGPVVINYRVCDPGGLCATATLTIAITPVNDSPVATNTTVSTNEDTQKSGDLKPHVSDPDNTTASLVFSQVGTIPATQGSFTLNADGTYNFVPALNFNGSVVITYQVCDPSNLCATATLTIDVLPVSDKPVVTPIASTTTLEDTPVKVCTTITDPDSGDKFSATICGVKNGTAVPTISGKELCVTYTPNLNYNGLDTVCVSVCDKSGLCDTIKIPVVVTPVNDKPVVVSTTLTTLEDTQAKICTTITDPDLGDAFTATLCGVQNGTATALIIGNQICVTYTPRLNYNGLDTICFIVTDLAGAFDTLKIPVVVTPVNDPPVVTPTSLTTPEDTPEVVCTPVSDVDDTDLSIDLCTSLAKNGEATAELLGNQVCMTYFPNPNFSGKDTVCLILCDLNGACDTVSIPVLVTPVNDLPTVDPLSISTLEDTPATACTIIHDIDLGETFNATPCGVKNGTAAAAITGNQICVTYTPNPNFNGLDTVCFNVCDLGGACVLLKIPVVVSPVNDGPTVIPTSMSTLEDKPSTVCTTIVDADLGDTFRATLCGIKNGGTAITNITGNQLCVTYTPLPNFNGVDTICVTVCDATDLCTVVRIPVVITPVNDSPTVNPLSIAALEDIPVTLCTTINDVDLGDTFTATSCGTKNGGTATAVITGNQLCVTYTSKLDYNGLDTACFTICDAANACVKIDIPVVVSPISDKPVVTPTRISTLEDTPATVCTPINDADVVDSHTATPCSETAKNGTATVVIKDRQLCVTYTPNLNFNGVDTICYAVCDLAGNCDVVKIPVLVTPVNDPPTITPTTISTLEDTQATVCTTINDVDLNETFKATQCGVKNGSADFTITGNQLCVTYTPNPNYNGVDTVCLVVCDKGDSCKTVKIPVVVTPVNDKPVIKPITISTLEDTPVVVCTTVKDVDLGDTFSIDLCGAAKNGDASATIDGTEICITYIPNANSNGLDTICLVICDAGNACDTLRIPVVVTPVNDSPTVAPITISPLEDTPATVCTTINDVDLNETFKATLCGVKNGRADFTILGNQLCVTYTPNLNYNGLDTVCVVLCDKGDSCTTVKIPVDVTPVNDKPILTPVSIETLEDTPKEVCTTVADVDLGDNFSIDLCGGPKNGDPSVSISGNKICITYTPRANFNGVDTICLAVCDAAKACDTIQIPIVVTPLNDKPVITPIRISTLEDTPATVCTTVVDPDLGEILSASLSNGGNNGTSTTTLTGNQLCITYTPKPNYNGKDTVCVVICDKANACDTLKIPVIIKPVNDTPSVIVVPFMVLRDDTRQLCFDIDDKDVNDTHKTNICGVTVVGAVASATVSNGQVCVTYTPAASYLGKDTICLILCDSSNACTQVQIPVVVTDCDDQLPPVFACPAKIEVTVLGTVLADPSKFIKDVRFSDNCDGLRFNFNKLTATDDCGTPIITQLSGLTKDSVFIEGKHYLRYEAKDISGKTTPCLVEIMVSPVKLLEASKLSVCPGESLSLKAKPYNGAAYKWTGPRNVNADSIAVTVPRTAGEAIETYTASATFGACTFTDSVTVTFRVRPVLNNDLFLVTMNTELKNSVLANDTTISLLKYTVKLDKPSTDGKLAFNADGTFVYSPNNNFTGAETFKYTVCPVDCPNTCETATATIKVYNTKFANKGMNVITPNNDGFNDALEIEGLDPNAPNNQSEIAIYNQWGNTVYHATSYKNDWRGTFNDNPLPVGTYYFIFRKAPDAVPLKEFVTIIR
jgi:large repetitive protein